MYCDIMDYILAYLGCKGAGRHIVFDVSQTGLSAGLFMEKYMTNARYDGKFRENNNFIVHYARVWYNVPR